MSVDPINYQASSRYEKSETTTMKLLLLFMFAAVTVAMIEVSENELARIFSRMFHITPEQSHDCIKKTGVTHADMRKMADSMEENEIEITDMKSVKTASCAMVCGAQKQGTMVGKEIKLSELNEYFQDMELPKEVFDIVTNSATFCRDNVEEMNEDDVCMVMYRFLKCMFRSLSMFGE